jgi:hypothetical protein
LRDLLFGRCPSDVQPRPDASGSWPDRQPSVRARSPAALVGRADTLFSDDAVTLIHITPRAVNDLALQSLVATFAAEKTIVDETATRTAVNELLDE